MFDKIKSAIFKATRNTLSRKDPEIVKWNNEMEKYEKKFFNEYLSDFNESNYEFLKLISTDNHDTQKYSTSYEKYQIIEDFKNLIKGDKNDAIIMTELVSDPSKRGEQLMKDLDNYRKRYDELFNDLELCAMIYKDPLLGDKISNCVVLDIFLHGPETEELENIKIKHRILL